MKKQRSLTVSQAAKRAKKIRYTRTVYPWSEKDTPDMLAYHLMVDTLVRLLGLAEGHLCAYDEVHHQCRTDEAERCGFCRRVEILPDDFEPRMDAGAEIVPTVAVEFEHRNPQRPASPEQVAEMFVRDMPSECRRIAAGLSPFAWMMLASLPYHQLRPGERRFMDL